jgi:hypothetical protein
VNPVLTFDGVQVFHGDCVEVMRSLPDNSVESLVTDPPYGLEFMGKDWDAPWKGDVRQRGDRTFDAADDSAPFGRVRHGGTRAYGTDSALVGQAFQLWCTEWATEALRVLKPGGHLLAFGGTRTWHRLAVAIEDAGFEVRDSIAWMYGSGFPKSLDVSKAIDKSAGAERKVIGRAESWNRPDSEAGHTARMNVSPGEYDITAPATPAAEEWQGWGTALKPAFEPIVVARKPLIGTVAANVLAHGTGGLNIDGCRIGISDNDPIHGAVKLRGPRKYVQARSGLTKASNSDGGANSRHQQGRWPANVILDESQAAELDKQSGVLTSGAHKKDYEFDEASTQTETSFVQGMAGKTRSYRVRYKHRRRVPVLLLRQGAQERTPQRGRHSAPHRQAAETHGVPGAARHATRRHRP